MPRARVPENFFLRTRGAKKIMVLDLGFLGDTVHLLPALWIIRRSYPEAELHVAVASHVTSIMDCVPWVNHVWGYMRFPRHATMQENIEIIRRLRREKFDVVINLNGSDRSSWLTFLSGARERLGRVPDDGGPLFWRQLFTAHVECPRTADPIYVQKCNCLAKAGFPSVHPEFHVDIPTKYLRGTGIAEKDKGSYFHISPFTTADYKELAPVQLAELIGTLGKIFPDKRAALSCAATERERGKMDALLALLPQRPWRVFAGDLNLAQIACVIKYSAVHFCGDTGTLHLAAMTQSPTVTWFWPNPSLHEWVPSTETCRAVIGTNAPTERYLRDIKLDELMGATRLVMRAGS